MREELISYETAKLAKEKGINDFSGEIAYSEDGKNSISTHSSFFREDKYPVECYRQSLLQKFLREVYNIHIEIKRVTIGSDEWVFGYEINYLPEEFKNVKRRCGHFQYIESYKESIGGTYSGGWDTYEECLEKALFEGLNLVK